MWSEHSALKERGGYCHLLPIGTGKCSKRLLDSVWALLKGYRKCPKVIGQPLENSPGLFESSWEMASSHWYLPSANRREGKIAQWLSAKSGNFRSFSSKCCISVYLHRKSKMHWQLLKTFNCSTPNYFEHIIQPLAILILVQSPGKGFIKEILF